MAPTDGVDYPGMLPPPPGVTPNFTNPDSMAWRLIVASVLCPVFATLFCLLRFYTARFVVRKTFRDDWLLAVSLIFAIALSAVDIAQTQHGMCIHMWDVTPARFQRVIIVGMPASVFYNLATLFVKASILSFYLRFAAANRPFQIAAYILLFVIVGYSLNAAFSFLYLCTPMRSLWDSSVPGNCVDLNSAYLVSSVLNVATDVVILLLPIWLLWRLRVQWQQKMAVALALMPGGFVCAVSILRLASIPGGANDPDTTWLYCTNNIWCLVEIYVGIICACLPCLKSFAKHHFPGVFDISLDPPSNQAINFSILTKIPVRVRQWTTDRETESLRSEAVDTVPHNKKSGFSSSTSHGSNS